MAAEKSLSTIEKMIFLKSVEIFEHAAIEELGRIAALTEEIRFESGETIYQEGSPVDAIYIILQGRAAVLNAGKIVREVGEDADYEAKSHGRGVRVTGGEAVWVEGVPELLRRAIENVVRNAARFTAEGTNVEVGKKMLAASGLALTMADDMGDGARKVVALARGEKP